MTAPEGSWHGWAHGENALYLAPLGEEDRIGLYLQLGRETELAAVFMDPAMAQMAMDFLDASLTATASANAQLLQRLESEQPLLFQQPAPAGVAPIEEELDAYDPDGRV